MRAFFSQREVKGLFLPVPIKRNGAIDLQMVWLVRRPEAVSYHTAWMGQA